MKRIEARTLGGMVTSTILTLIVITIIFATAYTNKECGARGRTSMKKLKPKFVITTFLVRVATALALSVVLPVQAAEPRMSGIYLTAADYKEGRLAFEGDCKSKAHGLDYTTF